MIGGKGHPVLQYHSGSVEVIYIFLYSLLHRRQQQQGGITTLSIGSGLGLGSGITIGLSKSKKNREDITPVDVGVEWLTGTGPRDRTFYDGDYLTILQLNLARVLP